MRKSEFLGRGAENIVIPPLSKHWDCKLPLDEIFAKSLFAFVSGQNIWFVFEHDAKSFQVRGMQIYVGDEGLHYKSDYAMMESIFRKKIHEGGYMTRDYKATLTLLYTQPKIKNPHIYEKSGKIDTR